MATTGLGIALGSLGSIAINTGNNLQSLGMCQLEARFEAESHEESSIRENKVKRGVDGEIDS
jgi:hypothetical protein